ncbi:MAG: L-seryl-tRNA(Sec) selenium transferase [Fimbriimonadaceae bacterium]|nr:L-seryl-tRNA(Sec) selenium transferase [Fimbriimonadaceae bacterium]
MSGELRLLPKVDALRATPELEPFADRVRTAAARRAIERARGALVAGEPFDLASLPAIALEEARRMGEATLRPAINMSGVVLHTGLGRARLAESVADRVFEVARSHALLELDAETGKRGERQTHVRPMLCELTGAEDALVVNNAAAGLYLALSALAGGREVILSRGEMVEIGGSFRMPDIVRQSGCRLVEVGCTNKTRLSDYAEAITDDTAAILCCHPSNFRIQGFTEKPDLAELRKLGKKRGLLLIDDHGSGCAFETARYGLPRQNTMRDRIEKGADVVVASGDKLLGGPQAGLILGRREAVATLAKHPLARVLRVDKLTLAALEATVRLHLDGATDQIPTIWAMARPLEDVRTAAKRLEKAYRGEATVTWGLTELGGGSAPGEGVPTWRVGLAHPRADRLARALRQARPAVIGRIENDRVWLDPRTAEADEVRYVASLLGSLDLDVL